MLRDLTPLQFEDLCAMMCERIYGVRVERTVLTGDEGRDVIVHAASGPIIGECKHMPDGTVGRPVVQKLHSAVLTYPATTGVVFTTGRFSAQAIEYAAALRDVRIDLVDGAKLEAWLARAGLLGLSATAWSSVVRFPDEFRVSSWLRSRICSIGTNTMTFSCQVGARTVLHPYQLAQYAAATTGKVAGIDRTARWSGFVWLGPDGRIGHGARLPPKLNGVTSEFARFGVSPAREICEPSLDLARARTVLVDYLTRSLEESAAGTGRNGVGYRKVIRPKASDLSLYCCRTLYVAEQRCRLQVGSWMCEGTLSVVRSQIRVEASSIACAVTGFALPLDKVRWCVVCGAPHRHFVLSLPLSVDCGRCGGSVCWSHARTDAGRTYCSSCAPAAASDLADWRLRYVVAVGGSGGVVSAVGAAFALGGASLAEVATVSAFGGTIGATIVSAVVTYLLRRGRGSLGFTCTPVELERLSADHAPMVKRTRSF